MTESSNCACCAARLEPAQELRFLVETANLDDRAYLERIRRLPAVEGRPVPVCQACQVVLEYSPPATSKTAQSRPVQSGVLAAVGLLSVGWLLQNVVFGPRA